MAAYYNEFDPFAAACLRELIKNNLIADGEVDERSLTMFELMNCEDLPSAISLPASVVGALRYGRAGGVMTNQSGQVLAHASHLVVPETKKENQTNATSGPSGSTSSASAALQRSLENKLRARLPMGGLTMFIKGWKPKVTPSGRQYCQLAVSARPINATDCGLWQAPVMDDAVLRKKGKFNSRGEPKLSGQVAMWTTPKSQNANSPCKHGQGGMGLQDIVSLWPTPNASDNRDRGSWDNPSVQRRVQIGKQIGLTAIAQGTGKLVNGSTVRTEKRGSLNPAFVCWLMGFPTAWERCGDTVTLLSRKSRRNS